MPDRFKPLRHAMVEQQLIPRGISDEGVLEAMRCVPRHAFMSPETYDLAYLDSPQAIGDGQTISQPYIVALMTQSAGIQPGDRVLELGTGSGYQAAVLCEMGASVYSIERVPKLAEQAQLSLEAFRYPELHLRVGDGTLGWAEAAPFDAILVTAAAPDLPSALIEQLKVGGSLIIPVGERFSQDLVRVTKTDSGTQSQLIEYVRFVPLIGEKGWKEDET